MNELRELYQELIIDHSKRPRNFHPLPDPEHRADGYNPLCGDKVTVYLNTEDGRVQDISFQGSGCAISTASASLMTETLKGRSRNEVAALFKKFHRLLTQDEAGTDDNPELGKLVVFSGVREFPLRVKCASLPWHTMNAALERKPETISTE